MSAERTIAAKATPPGIGGVGIIRLSGPNVKRVAQALLGKLPQPRYATYCEFKDQGEPIDKGLALYFPAPHSFTGEDVLELHGHGGPVVLDRLLKTILNQGVDLARPGEFSERAFLNDKIDLTQAEAIADLIHADSEQAAQSAMRSLQGEFSEKINVLSQEVIELRKLVEAAIDFPEEEIDFLGAGDVAQRLSRLIERITQLLKLARQGVLLREGMTVAIAGRPNAGKSSLLNCLSGKDSAIVTEIEGTTRDLLREHIQLDGLPLHIIDTAGLRETHDVIEQEGVRRALNAISEANLILLMVDGSKHTKLEEEITRIKREIKANHVPLVLVENKIDLTEKKAEKISFGDHTLVRISVKSGLGIELLREHLKSVVGYKQTVEGLFIARQRHLESLNAALKFLLQAERHFGLRAGELLAEELRLAHKKLGEIVGEFSSDDLLGEIFSSFCIGK